MIVLHRCDPGKNLFRVYRLDYELYLEGGLFGTHEKARIVRSWGVYGQPLQEMVLGPVETTSLDSLFNAGRKVLREKLEEGYHVVRSGKFLGEKFGDILAMAPHAREIETARAMIVAREARSKAFIAKKNREYLAKLEKGMNQGRLPLPGSVWQDDSAYLNVPDFGLKNGAKQVRNIKPRNKTYTRVVEKLGQFSFGFDEDDEDLDD